MKYNLPNCNTCGYALGHHCVKGAEDDMSLCPKVTVDVDGTIKEIVDEFKQYLDDYGYKKGDVVDAHELWEQFSVIQNPDNKAWVEAEAFANTETFARLWSGLNSIDEAIKERGLIFDEDVAEPEREE